MVSSSSIIPSVISKLKGKKKRIKKIYGRYKIIWYSRWPYQRGKWIVEGRSPQTSAEEKIDYQVHEDSFPKQAEDW